jgi:hypothetical protein
MRSTPLTIALLVAASLLALPPAASAASAGLSLSGSGTLSLDLTASIPNGSALRAALDGDFEPLVDAIVTNESQRSTILQQIEVAESTPIIGSLFGNRDGTVEPTEVTQFETLLQEEAQLLPAGTISGTAAVGLTLDGHGPDSSRLAGVGFSDATGPVASTLPVPVTTSLSYGFPYTGSSHRLALTLNLTPTTVPLGVFTGAVGISFTTPTGMTITGTAGFDQVTVTNDALGWGAASLAGSFTPATQQVLAVSFGSSTPWGYVLLIAPIAAAVGVGGYLLVRRRRRRLRSPP